VGYPCYVTGLLLFDRFDLLVLPIVGAVIIGFGGALLWAAVNYVAMSYADEHEKGRFYGFQAAMSAFGNFVASCLVLGINVDDNAADGVPLSVYLTFIAVMCIAVVVALLLVQPSAVRRKDGSALAIYQQETMMQELVNVSKLVFDWKAMALCPALFVAEYCLILQPGISCKQTPPNASSND
jgi:MFS family permease